MEGRKVILVCGGAYDLVTFQSIEVIKEAGFEPKVITPTDRSFNDDVTDEKEWSITVKAELIQPSHISYKELVDNFEMGRKKHRTEKKIEQFETRNLGRKTGGSKHKKNPFDGWRK